MAGPTQEQLLLAYDNDDALGIPRGTTAKQITAESDWEPDAVSAKGARGYVQVLPKTLATLEERTGRSLDPSNYDDALFIQRSLMRENLNHFGNLADALRAYNGGWDPSTWDNTETSGYVQKILGSAPGIALASKPPKQNVIDQELGFSSKFKPSLDAASAELLAQPTPTVDMRVEDAAQDQSAQQVADTTHKAGAWESFKDAFNWDTATGGILDLFRQDDTESDPNWKPTESDLQAMGKNNPEVWANDGLRDYVLGASSEGEWRRRMQTAQERAEFLRRYGNTHGWIGAADGLTHFLGGMADPVTLAATIASGAAVGLTRASLLAAGERATGLGLGSAAVLAGAENAGIYAGIRKLRNQDVHWSDVAQQALFGAALGAAGHLLAGKHPENPPELNTMIDGAGQGLDESMERILASAGDSALPTGLGEGRFVADLPSQTHLPVASDDAAIAALEREREQLTATQTDPLALETANKKQGQLDLLQDHPPTEADIKPLAKQLQQGTKLKFKEAMAKATKQVQRSMREHQERVEGLQQSLAEHQDALATQRRLGEIDQELQGLRNQDRWEAPTLSKSPITAAVQGAMRGMSDERLPALEKETASMPASQAAGGASGRAMLQDIAANSKDPVTQALATRLAEQLKQDTRVDVTKATGDSGTYDPLTHRVELSAGASESTKMHELAHAALARKVAFGLAHPETEHGALVAELNQVRRAAQKAYTGASDTVKYHMKDLHEFIAGLYGGNKEFLGHLASVKTGGVPLLSKLVDIVRNLLGIPTGESNALLKALGLSDKLGDLDLPEKADMGVLHSPPMRDDGTIHRGVQDWLDRAKAYDETPGTEKIAKQRQRTQAWANNPIRKTPGWKLLSKYWTTVGFSLATSKSKLARMIGATVGVDPTGLNRTSSTSAALDMEHMFDMFRHPALTVYKGLLPKMMSWKERIDTWFGGGVAAEKRVGKLVAEERARHRQAVQAGREHVATTDPLVRKLAGSLDGFWKSVSETGKAAGDTISENIHGSGWLGYMPYRWDWQAIRDAFQNHPEQYNALKENFRRQYIAKVLDPALDKALEKGPMRPEEMDELRAALMDRVNHLTDNYLNRVMQAPMDRFGDNNNHFGAIAEQLLHEGWAGLKITREVADQFGKRLQEVVDNRERTEFDLLSEVNGVRMLDYLDTDIGRMVQTASSTFAGRIALTKVGLGEPKQLSALEEALTRDNATKEDVDNVRFLVQSMQGDLRGKSSAAVTLLRDAAYASFMGKLGFNALADTPVMVSAIGVTGMLRAFGRAAFQQDSGMMRFLEKHAGSVLGMDYRLASRRTPDTVVQQNSILAEGSRMRRLMGNAKDMVGTLSLLNLVSRMQHRAFSPFMAEEIFQTIKSGKGLSPERLADMGVLPKDVERVRAQITKYDADRERGGWINMDKWDDQYAADVFIQSVHQAISQVLQRAHVGETPRWNMESEMGQAMAQFRNFGITAAGKQLVRNVAIGDSRAYLALGLSAAWGAALYYARVQADTLHMNAEQREKHLKENLSGWRLATGIAVMINMSGILPEVLDTGRLFFGGTQYSASEPLAALSFLQGALKAGNAAGTAVYGLATGHKPNSVDPVNYHKELRQMMRVLPGSNTILGTALSNTLNTDQ